MNFCAILVRKKHIFDALSVLENSDKKGSQLIRSVLEAARANGIKKGLSEERFFVKEVILGKANGPKKIDIRARGKFGMI